MTDQIIAPDKVLPELHKAIAELERAGIEIPATLFLAAIVLAFLDRRQS